MLNLMLKFISDFEIDPESGLIHTTKALIGLARAHPYKFSVIANDQGFNFFEKYLSLRLSSHHNKFE